MSNPKMSSILEGLGQVNERQRANAYKRARKKEREYSEAEIEKERKEQGAPKEAEYDAETGYFLKPGETDIYWSQKNKAYTLKWNGKDFVDESVDEAKGSNNQIRAMGKKMQLMAQVASNDVIMSFNDGKGGHDENIDSVKNRLCLF